MIVKPFKWIGFFVLCLILQTTIVQSIAIYGREPDLIFIALFLLAIRYGSLPAIYAGFLVGLSQDLYSPALLGQNALAKTIVGFFIGLFNEKMMRTDPILKMLILLVAFIAHDLIFHLAQIIKFQNSYIQLIPELLTETVPRALYSIIIIAIYYVKDLFLKPSYRK